MTSLTRALALSLCLVGFSTSALMLLRSLTGTSACGLSGGCDVVAASEYSSVFGVPLTVWGLLAFGLLGTWLLVHRGPAWPRLARALAIVIGLGGLGLITLQIAVIGALCPWCVCVDVASIGLGVVAALGRPLRQEHPLGRPRLVAAMVIVGGLAPALTVDTVLQAGRDDGPAPDASALAQAERPDAARVVEFVDIECPFCREQYARMEDILEELGRERIEIEVRHVPIPRHVNARPAAAIATCSEEQGLGHEVLDALMRASDISEEACRREAERCGVDLATLDQCLASEVPTRRFEADMAVARKVGLRSLPTYVIGDQVLEGLKSPDELRAALQDALREAGQS